MPAQSPQELLLTELQAIRSAEEQLSQLLPKHAERVQAEQLRPLLDERLQRGERLLQQLEQGLQQLDGGGSKGQQKNEAVEGLLRLADRELKEASSPQFHDAILVGNIQKIEHYCIAAWGAAKSFARLLGQEELATALQAASDQGKRFDDQLSELAERELNPLLLQGAQAGEQDGAGEDGNQRRQGGSGREQRSFSGSSEGGEDDLKDREYRDEDGEIRHHTRSYMEQHGGGR